MPGADGLRSTPPHGTVPAVRHLPLLLLPLAVACDVDCEDPTEANGTYAVFANVITWEVTNEDAFPSYMSPANGFTEWSLGFPVREGGPVEVTIDGQPFVATATTDDTVCGAFSLDFEGTYTSTRDSTHAFAASGDFAVFGPQLVGQRGEVRMNDDVRLGDPLVRGGEREHVLYDIAALLRRGG